MTQSGGCLCGDLRYSVEGEPEWVTTCYCRFCQTATGSDYMVEPLFPIGRMNTGRSCRPPDQISESTEGESNPGTPEPNRLRFG